MTIPYHILLNELMWRQGIASLVYHMLPKNEQVAQLSQRDRDAGWVMAKSERLGLRDDIYGHYTR